MDFSFDPTTGELKYTASGTGIPAERMLGAWIQRGADGENGAAMYHLLMRGEAQGSGVIRLPPADHPRLREGHFYVAVYTVGSPMGKARAQLTAR